MSTFLGTAKSLIFELYLLSVVFGGGYLAAAVCPACSQGSVAMPTPGAVATGAVTAASTEDLTSPPGLEGTVEQWQAYVHALDSNVVLKVDREFKTDAFEQARDGSTARLPAVLKLQQTVQEDPLACFEQRIQVATLMLQENKLSKLHINLGDDLRLPDSESDGTHASLAKTLGNFAQALTAADSLLEVRLQEVVMPTSLWKLFFQSWKLHENSNLMRFELEDCGLDGWSPTVITTLFGNTLAGGAKLEVVNIHQDLEQDWIEDEKEEGGLAAATTAMIRFLTSDQRAHLRIFRTSKVEWFSPVEFARLLVGISNIEAELSSTLKYLNLNKAVRNSGSFPKGEISDALRMACETFGRSTRLPKLESLHLTENELPETTTMALLDAIASDKGKRFSLKNLSLYGNEAASDETLEAYLREISTLRHVCPFDEFETRSRGRQPMDPRDPDSKITYVLPHVMEDEDPIDPASDDDE
ncbi:unnamed protein product [Amoebophrya sp. A120]|nr:unnamed protein product [Amoebophrya sp. A120]|eukprot:GSA120T00014658001.1